MFHLRHWNNQVSTVKWQETFQQLITLVEEQKLMMLEMDAQYDLLNIHKAIDVLESPKKTKGKIFLTSY